MNTMSWLIYLTNVIPSIGVMFGAFGIIGMVIVVIMAVVYGVSMDSSARSDQDMRKGIVRVWNWLLPVSIIFLLIANLVPNTTTMRLILASEMGETVVTNPEVVEVFDLLKQRLKDELAGGDE